MTSRPGGAAALERPREHRRPVTPGRAGQLSGVGELLRLAVRRDRILLLIWIYVLTIIAAAGGFGVKSLYGTAASRASLAATIRNDEALAFLYGHLYGTSLGAVVAWRYLAWASLAAGLMSIFLVVRHTRADEEAGRLELVGSTVVGRPAPLTVALVLAGAASVVIAVLAAVVLALSGLPLIGAFAFGLAEACCGLVFAALAAIAAQVSGTARGARGMAIAALGVLFLLRAVGDSGGRHGLSWLSWATPIGWAEQLRPFAGDRWWVLAVPLAAAVAGGTAAFELAAHRDLGAGLVPPRPGPPRAGRLLSGPLGLAWRLQRGALAGWAAGFLAIGLAIGVVANGIGQLLGSSTPKFQNVLSKISEQSALTNAYLAACASLIGLVAAAYATSVVLRLRTEEADGLAEPVLAGSTGRVRWGGSQLLVTLAGTAVVLVAGGFGMGLAYGLAISEPGTQVAALIGACVVQLPAALAVAGVAWVLVGVLPRPSQALGWLAVALCGLIALFGPAINLSQAVLDISPFTHVPKLPGGALSATPLIWLSAAALALAAVGLAGLRQRDVG